MQKAVRSLLLEFIYSKTILTITTTGLQLVVESLLKRIVSKLCEHNVCKPTYRQSQF